MAFTNKEHSKQIKAAALNGFSLKCPACRKGDIFHSKLKLKLNQTCPSCGLSFKDFDTGDGPAYISICLVGVLIPLLAVLTEIYIEPSFLVHGLLWGPLIFIFSFLTLIYGRSVFIWVEYTIKKLEKENSSK